MAVVEWAVVTGVAVAWVESMVVETAAITVE